MERLFFLNPTALWMLLLLAVVLALYVLRMPRARFPMSSVAYLRSMDLEDKRRRRHWRSIFSFLFQIVLLGILAFAAAKPLLSSGRVMERRYVVIMDTSASMRARDAGDGLTRFEKAKRLAADLAKRMEYGDLMLLVAVDERARIVHQFEKDRRTILRVIERMEPGFQPTRLEEALKLVREVVRPLADPRIFLITDAAVPFAADEFKETLAKTRLLTVGEKRENLGIVSFSSRKNLDSERDFSVLMGIRSTFSKPCKARLILEIGKNKTQVDSRDLEIRPGETRTEAFELQKLVGGRFAATVRLIGSEGGPPADADVYSADNVAYEWIPRLERVKTLVVAPDDDAGGYLDAAMKANISAKAYRVTPEKYNRRFNVEAVVFYNWLPDAFPDCNVLLVNTKSHKPDRDLVERFVLAPVMRSWDRTHPLMNYISMENLILKRARQAPVERWLEPVARTVQAPILLAGRRDGRKIVYMTFDPRESDFPFRVAFPALVGNALQWFARDDGPRPRTQIRPGEVYEIRIPDSVKPSPGSVTVVDPTGQAAEAQVREGVALYENTVAAGVYRYELGGRKMGFAVSMNAPDESDIAPRADLSAAVRSAEESEIGAPVVERELWFSLALIAMLGLCVESYLFHQRILF